MHGTDRRKKKKSIFLFVIGLAGTTNEVKEMFGQISTRKFSHCEIFTSYDNFRRFFEPVFTLRNQKLIWQDMCESNSGILTRVRNFRECLEQGYGLPRPSVWALTK